MGIGDYVEVFSRDEEEVKGKEGNVCGGAVGRGPC